jgi:hypothetical protein
MNGLCRSISPLKEKKKLFVLFLVTPVRATLRMNETNASSLDIRPLPSRLVLLV